MLPADLGEQLGGGGADGVHTSDGRGVIQSQSFWMLEAFTTSI